MKTKIQALKEIKEFFEETKENCRRMLEIIKMDLKDEMGKKQEKIKEQSKLKAEKGDFIEINGDLCLVVRKEDWEMELCEGDLAVVILKIQDKENKWDCMRMAYGYQMEFQLGDYKIIPREEALEILK